MNEAQEYHFKNGEKESRISFYVVAHADDWQLFMQPNAYNDLISKTNKVVFIITTAGDAGLGEKHWRSREEGMKSSLRFCLAPLTVISEKSGLTEFRGHTINYCSLNNATCYFLRLPDGSLTGSGFAENNFESLQRFRTGKASTITAVDHSTTYFSWPDLVITIHSLIESEMDAMQNGWINYLNPEITVNTDDHPDHVFTGHAIREIRFRSCLQHRLFAGYSMANGSQRLNGKDLFWKIGMFAAYEKKVFDDTGYSTLGETVSTYQDWCLSAPTFTVYDNSHSVLEQTILKH